MIVLRCNSHLVTGGSDDELFHLYENIDHQYFILNPLLKWWSPQTLRSFDVGQYIISRYFAICPFHDRHIPIPISL